MRGQSILLLITLGLSLSTAQADSPPSLDTLHQVFSSHDQRVLQERGSWQAPYQHAVALSQSATPQQALPAFETLLETLAAQEIPFSRVYARYFTLAEQLYERPRTLAFLQTLATRDATPWVLGALHETQALVESRKLTEALGNRLRAQPSKLAEALFTLYQLALPYGIVHEAERKAEFAQTFIQEQGSHFDRQAIDELVEWRYRRETPAVSVDLAQKQHALE